MNNYKATIFQLKKDEISAKQDKLKSQGMKKEKKVISNLAEGKKETLEQKSIKENYKKSTKLRDSLLKR